MTSVQHEDSRKRPNRGKPLSNDDERLGRLSEELARHRKAGSEESAGRTSSRAGYAQAMRMSSEFIAGILLGAALGWLVDRLFGTSPWGLIVFFMLGFAAGILNVLRSAKLVDDPMARLERERSAAEQGKDRTGADT